MSYVMDFYKAKEHDYEGFFSQFEEDEETLKVKSELNSLLKLVEVFIGTNLHKKKDYTGYNTKYPKQNFKNC